MRIVLDANVIVSAALSKKSISYRAFEKTVEKNVLLISEDTFDELFDVLYRPKFRKYFIPEDTRPDILLTVLRFGVLITPAVKVIACRDPKDNMYLELALSGKANCIVTGDPDLQILNPFKNISIIAPKEFLENF